MRGGSLGVGRLMITGPSALGSPMKVIFFLAPLAEMHNFYGLPPLLDLPCSQTMVDMFYVRTGKVPPVPVEVTHGSAFCCGIYSNCRWGTEAVRQSLTDTNTQVLGTCG